MDVQNTTPQTVLGGYREIGKDFVQGGLTGVKRIGNGMLTGGGICAGGIVLGCVGMGVGIFAATVGTVRGIGGLVYTSMDTARKLNAHTYRSLTPGFVQNRLDRAGNVISGVVGQGADAVSSRLSCGVNAVVNSTPVQTTFSFCKQKVDSIQKGAWEMAAASILPLSSQGESDRMARGQKHVGYPERQTVLDHQVSWKYPFAKYSPPYYDAPSVLENERIVLEALRQEINATLTEITEKPVDFPLEDLFSLENRSIKESCLGKITIENGTPLNPRGRTGLAGRGDLPDWGPNYEARPMVTRFNSEKNCMEALVVKGNDGKWALPARLANFGEALPDALTAVLKDLGIQAPFELGMLISQSYVEDPRNTDNAWIESQVLYRHLGPEEGRSEPTAKDAAWIAVHNRFDLDTIDEETVLALSKIEI